MIKADGLRLLPAESTGIHDSIAALVLLSAAGHLGAVLWALSGEPSNEISTEAGSAAVLEVTLVAGPARASPDDAAQAEPGSASPAAARQMPTPQPRQTANTTADAAPEHVTSADRAPPSPVPAERDTPLTEPPAALPPTAVAPPVPPPKPDRPAEARTIASLPAAADSSVTAQPASPAMSAREAADAATGGNQGAAPRADNPAPSYPLSARRRGQEGRVILRVEVLPEGGVGDVILEKSSGVASLDQAALDTVRRWRFRPARENGRPVAATVQVPIRFALK